MKDEAKAKAATTKKMNQLAGARPAFPGQSDDREASLRATLASSFRPEGAVEMLWVNDIAYCTASIEVIRAQISALRRRLVEDTYRDVMTAEEVNEKGETVPVFNWSHDERDRLIELFASNFSPHWRCTFLDDPLFGLLLARANRFQLDTLRMLQQMLHDETRERDRIINQFERRRRNAMRDAIELAEEARRAEVFRRLSTNAAPCAGAIEDASFEVIEADTAVPAPASGDPGNAFGEGRRLGQPISAPADATA